MRMRTLAAVLGAALFFLTTSALLAGEKSPDKKYQVKIDKKTQDAIDQGLKYLKEKQNTDGSWSSGRYPHNTAITGFAMLAFMSQGHLPNQGYYGPEVAKAARFLMAAQRKGGKSGSSSDDGYVVGSYGGNMYCHGMATLALAELFGSTTDTALKPVVEKAVKLIIDSQNREGGWRYNPNKNGDADISVTIMMVMALRAAKNGGLHVPDKTMDDALNYIVRCNDSSGGFTYQPGNRSPGFARTAAGMCVLFLTGKYKAKELPKAVDYLKKNYSRRTQHYFYGMYYAAHAMHQVGGDDPKEWYDWYHKVRDELLDKGMQSSDGSWSRDKGEGVGPVYQTSIAVIILSVPAHYLPIFQK
jgi:squalene cyclase